MGGITERLFKLKQYGAKPHTEVMAGLTTFITMAYIIIVNQSILSQTGMPAGGVMIATCIAAAVGTFMMAFVANLPYAQASGMGLNAFFTFTVCFGFGYLWNEALAMVLISGLLGILITVTGVRRQLIASVPKALRTGIGVGIGLFVAYIGIKDAGLLQFTLNPGSYADVGGGTIVSDAGAIPAFIKFNSGVAVLAVIAIVVTLILLARRYNWAILGSIVLMTIVGAIFGYYNLAGGYLSTLGDSFRGLGDMFGQAIISIPDLFGGLSKALLSIAVIFSFFLVDVFDTIGTFIGTGLTSGTFTEKEIDDMTKGHGLKTRIERGLFSDVTATSVGAILGTSTVTTYVESGAGIAAGGKTGLTAFVTAVCFLLAIPFAPFVIAVPAFATAPALIAVGILMLPAIKNFEFTYMSEVIPLCLTIFIMPFTYSITSGIAVGFIFFVIMKLFSGGEKEKPFRETKGVKPEVLRVSTAVVACIFLLNFIVQAVMKPLS